MSNNVQLLNQLQTAQNQPITTFMSKVQDMQQKNADTKKKILDLQQVGDQINDTYLTRQQMLNSLIQLNEYKQKIIYLLICAIVLIFIAFGIIVYTNKGSINNTRNRNI
jgi:hypothetical protein